MQTAEAQKHTQTQTGYGYIEAPISHRQPTQHDVKRLEKDNEQFDLPASQDDIIGVDQLQSEENALAKMIEQENDRLNRQLKGICRGC